MLARILVAASFVIAARAQNVLTAGYNPGRTNANLTEGLLSPATVFPQAFGKLFTLPVDGEVDAQPLYEQNVSIPGQGLHNVVFVGTEHNSIFAFDADAPGSPLWTVNLGPSVPSSAYNPANGSYTDIVPEIGILGTPAIDATSGTLYVVAATSENGNYYHRLHALDITDGNERFGAPVTIAAQVAGGGESSSGGVMNFIPLQHLQRPALLLSNGVVYVAFGSHGDGYPWHGWMMGYKAANVQAQTAVFNATPNGWGGAIWQSGRGPSADSEGNIYVVTSNGDSDDISDFSDAVLELDPDRLAIQDWFAPSDQQTIDDDDDDLGSAGAMLIPGTSFLATGGKQGLIYLLNTDSLGHMSATNGQIPQSFPAAGFGIFNMAVWNRSGGPVLYTTGANVPFSAYQFTGDQIDTIPSSQSASFFNIPYQGMSISANGGEPGSGILWVTTPDSWPLPATGTLHAFDADNLSQELWNSSMKATDALGDFSKFASPTVANGKVYAPTASHQLAVYGIFPASPTPPVITGLVNAASYANGPVAPGEIVCIYGQNLGPQVMVTGSSDENGDLNVDLDGTEVTFNGVAAPIVSASAGVITAIVPFEIAGSNQVTVEVSYYGSPPASQTYNVAPSAPGIFTDDASGSGEASILNQNGSLNSATNPALPGSVIVLYATGGGVTTPVEMTGSTAQSKVPLAGPTSATIGGLPAQVIYAGDAPGDLAGMIEFDLEVSGDASGIVPVVLTIDGNSSQTTATVAIKGLGSRGSFLSRRVPRVP